VLLIAGKNDTYVHPDNSRALQKSIGGSQCQLWLVDKAKHNTARQVDPAAYDAKISTFFNDLTSAPVELVSHTRAHHLESTAINS